MTLWRINMKPDASEGIDVAEFCIKNNIVGIGWSLESAPLDKEDYWKKGELKYQSGWKGWKVAANVMLYRMAVGDLVWTRNQNAKYFLGRVESDWRHENGQDYLNADIANVRSCSWKEVGDMTKVPGAVINSFRPAATVQKVTDSTAERYSTFLYADLTGQPRSLLPTEGAQDIFSLISAEDLEDVVAVWLQITHRCVAFTSTCKPSTMAFECLFVSLDGKESFGLQVKSGSDSIDRDVYAKHKLTAILFAASGKYLGNAHPNCVCVEPEVIRSFVMSNEQIMPKRVQFWIEKIKSAR